MTVTSTPAELRAAANRAHAQGMYAEEAGLLTEALANNIVVQRDATATSAAATDTTNLAVAIAASRVRRTAGADGRVIDDGPVT